MINAYVDPFSEKDLSNKLFKDDELINRDGGHSIWCFLRQHCFENNININTIDLWNKDKANLNDVIICLNDKENNSSTLELFNYRFLFQFEPPVVMPNVYKNLINLNLKYNKVFLSCKVEEPVYTHFLYPQIHNDVIFDYWKNENRKFLVLINSNKKPKLKKMELYSARIKAIQFFAGKKDIDLYGFGWDRRPFFPFTFSFGIIKKVYKGTVSSKYQTLSNYTFSICFENMIMDGYITEKIFDCLFTGTIPVYLGAPEIEKYVPRNCFIDMRDFKNFNELHEFLRSLTVSEIRSYKENSRKYLRSEQYKPFTKEYFSKRFVEIILETVNA